MTTRKTQTTTTHAGEPATVTNASGGSNDARTCNPWGLLVQAPMWRPGLTPDDTNLPDELEHKPRAKRKPWRPQHGTPFNLTPREMDVMRALIEGHSVESAGLSLGISSKTVQQYIDRAVARIKPGATRTHCLILLDRQLR